MTPIIQPKRPRPGAGFIRLSDPPAWVTMGYGGERWWHEADDIAVISAVEVAKDDDGVDRGPEYHISISRGGHTRISAMDAKHVLAIFDCEDAEEDNHVPHGIVRNYWRPIADRFVGMECACKADEPAIKEDRGDYVWRGTGGGHR